MSATLEDQYVSFLLESAPDMHAVIDDEGVFLYVSPTVQRELGYPSELLVGQSIQMILVEDELGEFCQFIRTFIQNGSPGDSISKELLIRNQQGERLLIASSIRMSTSPLHSDRIIFSVSARKRPKPSISVWDCFKDFQESCMQMIDLLPDVIVIHKNFKMQFANHTAFRLFESDQFDDVVGRDIRMYVDPSYHASLDHHWTALQPDTLGNTMEIRLVTSTGKTIEAEVSSAQIHFDGGSSILTVARDITRRKSVQRQLHEMNYQLQLLSNHDALTGVGNRRSFEDTLEQALALLSGNEHKISLIMMDIDCFKLYNDTYGHPQGDQCLRQVAQATVKASGERAFVGRYGGEEFAVLLPFGGVADANQVANAITVELEALQILHQQSTVAPYITVSMGIGYIASGETADANLLVHRADRALYQAKQNGRNQIMIWNETAQTHI